MKFGVRNEEKLFYQTKDHYFLFLKGETENFPKNKLSLNINYFVHILLTFFALFLIIVFTTHIYNNEEK